MPSFESAISSFSFATQLKGDLETIRGINRVEGSMTKLKGGLDKVGESFTRAQGIFTSLSTVGALFGASTALQDMRFGDGPQTPFAQGPVGQFVASGGPFIGAGVGRLGGQFIGKQTAKLASKAAIKVGSKLGFKALGASIGTALTPGLGTAIGAVVGEILGFILPAYFADSISDWIGTDVLGQLTDKQLQLEKDIATGKAMDLSRVAPEIKEMIEAENKRLEKEKEQKSKLDVRIGSRADLIRIVDEKVKRQNESWMGVVRQNQELAAFVPIASLVAQYSRARDVGATEDSFLSGVGAFFTKGPSSDTEIRRDRAMMEHRDALGAAYENQRKAVEASLEASTVMGGW